MPRGSDFERALYGILSAIEGGQSASAADREYQLKLENRDLARRKALGEERRAKIEEFADLGAPLEQIERGMETSEAPTFRGTKAGGFTIGQEPTLGERQDVSAYERFTSRMLGRQGSDEERWAEAEHGRQFRAGEAEKSRDFQRDKDRRRVTYLPSSQLLGVRNALLRELETGRKNMRLSGEDEQDLAGRISDVEGVLAGRGVPGFKPTHDVQRPAPAPSKPALPAPNVDGKVRVRLPDGQVGTVPRVNLERLKREHGAVEIQ